MRIKPHFPLASALLLAACSPAEPSNSRAAATTFHAHGARPMIAALAGSYQTAPLSTYGRLMGAVVFAGPAPVDTVTHITTDVDVCGTTLIDVTTRTHGARLAGAVVWLDGVTAGKHLPYTRRFDILTQGCRLLPRVQTAVAGGTLDVRSADPLTHHTRFVREGSVVVTVPETEEGQVVPMVEVLKAPGLIEVQCADHPWTKGWIAVFDHPYFTMTGDEGTFALDSIPPGRYKLSAWHERFGMVTDSVTIQNDVTTSVQLTFRPRARP